MHSLLNRCEVSVDGFWKKQARGSGRAAIYKGCKWYNEVDEVEDSTWETYLSILISRFFSSKIVPSWSGNQDPTCQQRGQNKVTEYWKVIGILAF